MACTNPQMLDIRERFENILCEMSDIYKNSDIEKKFVQIMNGQNNLQTFLFKFVSLLHISCVL